MKMVLERQKELLVRIQKEDPAAFHEFYEETKRIIFYNIFSYLHLQEDSEDLLQETYVIFLNNVAKIDLDKPVMAYLITISRNLCLNHIKKSSHTREFNEIEENTIHSQDSYGIEGNELINKISSILKPQEFRIFYLKAIEEYSHKEIASLLHKPLGSITWGYNNAIKKLQKGLGKEYAR